jgi:hypothetical protein
LLPETPTLLVVVLFTKIWTAVLAVLATACLAGMYLLSTGASGGFTEADKTAVRAVTEGGVAALQADVNSSPVSLGPSLLNDSRLKDALDPPTDPPPKREDEDGFEMTPEERLAKVLEDVANESLLDENPLMSVALVDQTGKIFAKTGLAPELFDELVQLEPMKEALKSEDAPLFSATIGGKVYAIKLSRPLAETQARRLVAIQTVELGGGSFFRRVVGDSPAGLVRGKEVVSDTLVGGAKPEDLIAWVEAHPNDIPPEGASAVDEVGEGGSTRIGAAARVPGPAGKGKDATVFVVLSAHDLASTQQDMATALTSALNGGGLGQLNWPLVGGLLAISLVLSFYLPHLEFNGPMNRLQGELTALIEGRKHQIDHDTYGGMFSTLGRSFTAALEAQRVSLDAALIDSDVDSGAARRTRGTRAVRTVTTSNRRRAKSRDHKVVGSDETSGDDAEAIELPSAGGNEVERHAAADLPPAPRSQPPAPTRLPPVPVPAPAFDEQVEPEHPGDDDSDAITLAAATGGDREVYYQRIYTEFVETKTACGESVEGFTYEKFAKKLRKQSDDLLGRSDVKDVEFSVYVKDGKAALRAKVIKA